MAKLKKRKRISTHKPPIKKIIYHKTGLEKKPLIIAAISLGAILVIALLFIFGKQFVGKAITFTAPEGFSVGAGIPIKLPLKAGDLISLNLGANLADHPNAESVAFSFETKHNPFYLDFINVDSKLASDWGTNFMRTEATNNKINFQHATINYPTALKGGTAYFLGQIDFMVLKDINTPDELNDILNIEKFEVLDMNNNHQNIFDGVAITQPSGVAICEDPVFETCQAICEDNKNVICQGLIDPQNCPISPTFNADLTSDNKIDGQDADIIFKTKMALQDATCGDNTLSSCTYGKLHICDDASFRIEGAVDINSFCPYNMGGGPE